MLYLPTSKVMSQGLSTCVNVTCRHNGEERRRWRNDADDEAETKELREAMVSGLLSLKPRQQKLLCSAGFDKSRTREAMLADLRF